MKPPRVLYVAKTARGGSAYGLLRLIRALDAGRYQPAVVLYQRNHAHVVDELTAAGVPVTVIAPGGEPPVTQPEAAPKPKPAHARPAWQRSLAAWGRGLWAFLRQDLKRVGPIITAIRQTEAEVVHINTGLRHGKPGLIAAWLTGRPSVCHIRMWDELSGFDRLFAPLASRLVFMSRALQEHYGARGVRRPQDRVIYDGLEVEAYSQPQDVAQTRAALGLAPEAPVVGIIGRLDWWKGHEYFLDALAQTARAVPEVRGLIIGEPERTPANQAYYEGLLRQTERLGLTDRVIFTGFRPDIPRLLATLDLVVHASSQPEPFGLVIIEGMAAGKPVVATAAGGVLDIITDHVDGLLVPCQEAAALSAAMTWALADPENGRRLGQAARRTVEARFTAHGYAAAIQALYDELLQARPTAGRLRPTAQPGLD